MGWFRTVEIAWVSDTCRSLQLDSPLNPLFSTPSSALAFTSSFHETRLSPAESILLGSHEKSPEVSKTEGAVPSMSERNDSERGGEDGAGVGTEEGNEDVCLDIVGIVSTALSLSLLICWKVDSGHNVDSRNMLGPALRNQMHATKCYKSRILFSDYITLDLSDNLLWARFCRDACRLGRTDGKRDDSP